MTLNPNWFLNATGQFTPIGSGQIAISTTTTTGFLGTVTKAATVDQALAANTATTVVTVAQGTSGTWQAIASATLLGSGTAANVTARLWDGTTTIASQANFVGVTSLAALIVGGVISNPAGNIRLTLTSSVVASAAVFNQSGFSNDVNLTVTRIG